MLSIYPVVATHRACSDFCLLPPNFSRTRSRRASRQAARRQKLLALCPPQYPRGEVAVRSRGRRSADSARRLACRESPGPGRREVQPDKSMLCSASARQRLLGACSSHVHMEKSLARNEKVFITTKTTSTSPPPNSRMQTASLAVQSYAGHQAEEASPHAEPRRLGARLSDDATRPARGELYYT